MKKNFLIFVAVFLVVATFLFLMLNSATSVKAEKIKGTVTLYKSSTCGCCGIYTSYMKDYVEKLDVVVEENMDSMKRDRGVPKSMESCHTMVIDGYFIEGHVPIEAIQKLLSEKPDIKGIALPGMPSGTPGMPGPKTETWVVYAVNHDGSSSEFMSI